MFHRFFIINYINYINFNYINSYIIIFRYLRYKFFNLNPTSKNLKYGDICAIYM